MSNKKAISANDSKVDRDKTLKNEYDAVSLDSQKANANQL